jgi:hypothetical protein
MNPPRSALPLVVPFIDRLAPACLPPVDAAAPECEWVMGGTINGHSFVLSGVELRRFLERVTEVPPVVCVTPPPREWTLVVDGRPRERGKDDGTVF